MQTLTAICWDRGEQLFPAALKTMVSSPGVTEVHRSPTFMIRVWLKWCPNQDKHFEAF